MKPSKKSVKSIKAWALIASDNEIGTVSNHHGVHDGHLAIYEIGTIFNKRIMKNYKLKIIPVLITPINSPRK